MDNPIQINSTDGYKAEILQLQNEHRPPNKRKLNTGMLCQNLRRLLHRGQCDGGHMMDSSAGILTIQTFAKLPSIAPKTPASTYRNQYGRQPGTGTWYHIGIKYRRQKSENREQTWTCFYSVFCPLFSVL